MPIYEYRCLECGFQDEFLQKVSEPPKTVCPSCGKETFKKLLSAAGFQLKGSGWYVTDFRDNGKKAKPSAGKEESKESKAGSDKGASPSADSDSKPASPGSAGATTA